MKRREELTMLEQDDLLMKRQEELTMLEQEDLLTFVVELCS